MKLQRYVNYNKKRVFGSQPIYFFFYLKSFFNDYSDLKLYIGGWGIMMKEKEDVKRKE